jgi:hypothetical protein
MSQGTVERTFLLFDLQDAVKKHSLTPGCYLDLITYYLFPHLGVQSACTCVDQW